jgi:hypothetical protein
MKEFNKKLQMQFDKMCQTGKLFRSDITGSQVWEEYMNSFENDPVYRDPSSSTHNCNTCNNFIRRYGNIVSIDTDYRVTSLFDFDIDGEYAPIVKRMSQLLRNAKIVDIFTETLSELQSLRYDEVYKGNTSFKLGVAKNVKRYTKEEAEKYGVVMPNEIREFHHIHITIPASFIDTGVKSVESIMATYRDAKNVFKRGMDTISLDTLLLVKDLINQGSLRDGETHIQKINVFISLKTAYDDIEISKKDNWCWDKSYNLPYAKFKNELMGVLCSELSEGEDLNKACLAWNKRVDPVNYMKVTAPITERQKAETKKFVEVHGYMDSFDRRLATMDDIKVSEILHVNVGKDEIKNVSIFDNIKTTSSRHKRNEFDGIEEVGIDKFMKDILPSCSSVEVLLTNKHINNMVTLTTAKNAESKPIFKWPNNYSWDYRGNLAGKSLIKESVKSQGGNVEGILRFSIMWADNNIDNSDLDAHCMEPNGNQIYFGNKISSYSGGNLDIDIRIPQEHKKYSGQNVVENIAFPSISKMSNGIYKFLVHQYSARYSRGFTAEIEFDGEIYTYEYNHPVSGHIPVADVEFKNGKFTINHHLAETGGSSDKTIYGLLTNSFHKVNLVCLSPNHWNGCDIGNKHYFLMLDGCVADDSIRGFHNENLIPTLLEQHRKVMDVLAATNKIDSVPGDKQLSGLGFNATIRDEVVLKLSGNFKRVIRVKF